MPSRIPGSFLALGALVGLTASFVAGAALTGSDSSPGAGPGPFGPQRPGGSTLPVSYLGSDLSLAASCSELLDWYVDRGVERVGPWGWDYPYMYGDVVFAVEERAQSADSGGLNNLTAKASAPAPPLAATSRVTNGSTGTNVQELGIDEPDVVKTDGRTLFRVEGGNLATYDVTGADVERLTSVDLPDLEGGEILVAGEVVVAIGADALARDGKAYDRSTAEPAATRVVVLDVSDPAAPTVEHSYRYDTALVTARLHGDTVRLVLQAGLPDLDFVTPDHGRKYDEHSDREALRENQEIVRESSIEDWLPTVTVDGGGPEQLLDCDEVALPEDGETLGTIAVVGFDATAPETTSVSGLAVDTDLAYASASQLYLATTPYSWGSCFDCFAEPFVGTPRWFPGGDDGGASHVYAFDLDGLDTSYAASGEIDGLIRDRWAMDEFDGVLRLAVSPTGRTGNFNSILTLRQEGNDLVETGRLDKLGIGEEIKSVRWFDGLAILVTFRQVDPLYAVDLTDAEEPTLMGKLKIPGFSGYLHPLGQRRLLGLGEGPGQDRSGWGAQAGLFNVMDLTEPRQLDVVSYGGNTYANAVTDPRQLTWLPEQRIVLSVITEYKKGTTGYVSVLELGDGDLSNRMVEVEYGDEVSQVRLVPLPDGRVVLVTGDAAEFFDL